MVIKKKVTSITKREKEGGRDVIWKTHGWPFARKGWRNKDGQGKAEVVEGERRCGCEARRQGIEKGTMNT